MISPYYWHRYEMKVAMKWLNKLWWKFMPGTTIKVTWPVGPIRPIIIDAESVDYDWIAGGYHVNLDESADPNDHYRPELEKKVGRQGFDWDWCLTNNDIVENKLTVKFRRGKDNWASYFAIKWG